MKTINTELDIKTLMNYREFDRVAKPRPQLGFFISETVETLVEKIREEGFKGEVELSVYKDTILLTEGNHRIAAMNILGYKTIPVQVNIYETQEEFEKAFYPHSRERFKKNRDYYFEVVDYKLQA